MGYHKIYCCGDFWIIVDSQIRIVGKIGSGVFTRSFYDPQLMNLPGTENLELLDIYPGIHHCYFIYSDEINQEINVIKYYANCSIEYMKYSTKYGKCLGCYYDKMKNYNNYLSCTIIITEIGYLLFYFHYRVGIIGGIKNGIIRRKVKLELIDINDVAYIQVLGDFFNRKTNAAYILFVCVLNSGELVRFDYVIDHNIDRVRYHTFCDEYPIDVTLDKMQKNANKHLN